MYIVYVLVLEYNSVSVCAVTKCVSSMTACNYTHICTRNTCLLFQGADFCSTAGFDTLVKRLKEGKRMCTDFEEYLEKRL